MSDEGTTQSKRRSIVCIISPDGTLSAQEVIIDHVAGEDPETAEVNVKAIPGTERILPLPREDAEKWVYQVLIDESEEEQTAMVKRLCGEDIGWTT